MRILVIEDEKNLATSLIRLLEGEKYAAEAVYDGSTGLDYARTGQYDALILDVMIPSFDGFQVASILRQEGNDVPILMLTAQDEVSAKVRGLDSGADDYLTKPFTTEELLARVRALLRRQGSVQTNEVTYGDVTLSLSNSVLTRENKQVRLSRKEQEVLRIMMALPPGHIIRKDDLIVKVWGADSDAQDNNVEAYISFLRKKLIYLGSDVQIINRRSLGYLLEYQAC